MDLTIELSELEHKHYSEIVDYIEKNKGNGSKQKVRHGEQHNGDIQYLEIEHGEIRGGNPVRYDRLRIKLNEAKFDDTEKQKEVFGGLIKIILEKKFVKAD